jgi:hypothetical protein
VRVDVIESVNACGDAIEIFRRRSFLARCNAVHKHQTTYDIS